MKLAQPMKQMQPIRIHTPLNIQVDLSQYTLHYAPSSPSSSDDDNDEDDRIVPFTLSPLDSCRGCKGSPKIRAHPVGGVRNVKQSILSPKHRIHPK